MEVEENMSNFLTGKAVRRCVRMAVQLITQLGIPMTD